MTEPGAPASADAGIEPPAAEAAPAVSPPPARRSVAVMAAVVIAVVAVDQLTKTWALRGLDDGRDVRVIGSLLKFTLTYNKGMAFSRGTGLGPVIGVVGLVVIVILLASLRRESSPLARVALSAVIGGALGNISDRLFRAGDGGFMGGAVVDFIQLPRWPVFNVADMAVTLGGLTLVVGAWRAGRHHGTPAGATAVDADTSPTATPEP